MSKLRTAVITAAIALPLGAFATDACSRATRTSRRPAPRQRGRQVITASQKANERVWGDEGSHGNKARR